MRLADALRGRDNNFNLLRLLAAALVLLSHSWPLTGTPGEPLERVAGFSLGHLGVDVFFVLSGFLVTRSLLSRGTLAAFARARALRIFPALVANAWLTAFVLGAFVTTLPLGAYLTHPGTWGYALENSVTWPLGVRWYLPGVFEHQPASGVNGALWSLPWELTMYLMLAAFGALMLARRPLMSRGGFARALFAIAIVSTLGHGLNEGFDWSRRFEVVQALRLGALFTTAGSLYLLRERVPLSGVWFALALAALALALVGHGFAMTLYPVSLAYVALWLALVPAGPIRLYNRLGDFSYGFYLWQFPVQQTIVLNRPGTTQVELALLATVPTLALAFASWHLLEKPMLALKDRGSAAPARAGVSS